VRESAFFSKNPGEFGNYQGSDSIALNSAATECRHVCDWQGDSRSHGGYLTHIAGKVIEYFRHDQDWGDGGMTEVVQRQFQLNRREEFMKAFVQDAIARVVKPWTDNSEAEEEPELTNVISKFPTPIPKVLRHGSGCSRCGAGRLASCKISAKRMFHRISCAA